ncbi:serine hydrolase [Streptosporangium fragile]|uniref:Serine hydrolase n=1 Tax=Streptosporangium fragile TaxID=46186 RepID=A0ABP6IFR0_9ACTN
MSNSTETARQIRDVFAAAGARGYLYAREIGMSDGPQVEVEADEPVVLASVFKIAVAVAFARAVAAGRLDPAERATIGARFRIGGIGTAGYSDDTELSRRDQALVMMTMSDNATTDALWYRLGQPAIQSVIDDLGLTRTRITESCEDLFLGIVRDLSPGASLSDLEELIRQASTEDLATLAAIDPARANASTPREIARLLEAVWTDQAAEPPACEQVRSMMRRQIYAHRLSSGFESGIEVAAKTGTLPGIRNEAGVVTYADGRSYAVTVFTRAHSYADRQPAVDASIGRAGRLAVDYLRSL